MPQVIQMQGNSEHTFKNVLKGWSFSHEIISKSVQQKTSKPILESQKYLFGFSLPWGWQQLLWSNSLDLWGKSERIWAERYRILIGNHILSISADRYASIVNFYLTARGDWLHVINENYHQSRKFLYLNKDF